VGFGAVGFSGILSAVRAISAMSAAAMYKK